MITEKVAKVPLLSTHQPIVSFSCGKTIETLLARGPLKSHTNRLPHQLGLVGNREGLKLDYPSGNVIAIDAKYAIRVYWRVGQFYWLRADNELHTEQTIPLFAELHRFLSITRFY